MFLQVIMDRNRCPNGEEQMLLSQWSRKLQLKGKIYLGTMNDDSRCDRGGQQLALIYHDV